MDDKGIKYCLVLLTGIPGSGKTTFIKYFIDQWKAKVSHSDYNLCRIYHICYDDLIPADIFNCPKNMDFKWKDYRQNITKNVDALMSGMQIDPLQKLEGMINENCLVYDTFVKENFFSPFIVLIFIDDNMYYRSMRYEYFQLARKHKTGFCIIYLSCSLSVALARNKNRVAKEIIKSYTIEKMANTLEPPDAIKFSWEKFCCKISTDIQNNSTTFDRVRSLILKAINEPVQDNNDIEGTLMSRKECSTNFIHQADISLRKIIARIIKNSSSSNRQELAKYFNGQKQEILKRLKTGSIAVPSNIYLEVEGCAANAQNALEEFLANNINYNNV